MRCYLVFLDLKNKKCVVIGGGSVAERKAVTLLSCKADVCVISPEITSRLRGLAKKKRLRYIKKRYEDKDIKDAFLVVAATTRKASLISLSSYLFFIYLSLFFFASPLSLDVISGLMTQTSALHDRSVTAFRSATLPPPITTHFLFLRSRKTG